MKRRAIHRFNPRRLSFRRGAAWLLLAGPGLASACTAIVEGTPDWMLDQQASHGAANSSGAAPSALPADIAQGGAVGDESLERPGHGGAESGAGGLEARAGAGGAALGQAGDGPAIGGNAPSQGGDPGSAGDATGQAGFGGEASGGATGQSAGLGGSSDAGGAESGGAESGGAESGGAESGGSDGTSGRGGSAGVDSGGRIGGGPEGGTSGNGGNAALPGDPTRGYRLVVLNNCFRCHGSDLAGRSFYRNITPDIETGVGSWSDVEIAFAIRGGFNKAGEMMCAAMPLYSGLDEQGARDMVAYLRSVPPVSNKVSVVCPGHNP